MRFFFDQYDEVSRRSASLSGVTTAADIELHSLLDPGRDIDRERFFSIYTALAFTGRTLYSNGCSLATAGRTCGNGLHLSQKSILHFSHLATSAAGAAGLHASFVFCASSPAGTTGNIFFYFDILCYT